MEINTIDDTILEEGACPVKDITDMFICPGTSAAHDAFDWHALR